MPETKGENPPQGTTNQCLTIFNKGLRGFRVITINYSFRKIIILFLKCVCSRLTFKRERKDTSAAILLRGDWFLKFDKNKKHFFPQRLMLFHSKKIKKSLLRRSTPDDILRCHLFAKFPQILFELCSRRKSLKKYLVQSVAKIIGSERQNENFLIDDFHSEFEDWVYFLTNEEDTLTELERNFKVFVSTLSRNFLINRELLNFLVLIVGFFLKEKKKSEELCSKFTSLKKTMTGILKFNVRFKTLRTKLSQLDQFFLDRTLDLLLKWKEHFEK